MKAGLAELEHWIYEAGEEVLFSRRVEQCSLDLLAREKACDFDVFTVDLFCGFVDLPVVNGAVWLKWRVFCAVCRGIVG